jgi:hypothetical protein
MVNIKTFIILFLESIEGLKYERYILIYYYIIHL